MRLPIVFLSRAISKALLIVLTQSLAAAVGAEPAQAAPPQSGAAVDPEVEGIAYGMESVTPAEFRGDVRDLPQFPLKEAALRRNRPLLTPPKTRKFFALPLAAGQESLSQNIPLATMPIPIQSFDGLRFNGACAGGQCGAGWPPDTNGDVGPNHYIQAVNEAYGIFNKTGTQLAAFTENQLWSGGGSNPCNGNSFGDPVVLYDQLADRWILTHFAFATIGGDPVSPFYECIAASKTSDPVAGGWWLYALRMDPGGTGAPPVGTLNDYPKFGIWPNCLYMAANEFTYPAGTFAGTVFASFSRSDLESGATLRWALGFINNPNGPFSMIPSNLRGTTAGAMPSAGAPNYFVSESQTAFAFEVRKFTAGTNCGGGGTLSAPTNVSQTTYTASPGGIAQPNTANMLDAVGDRLMQKVQYRKVGSTESLWVVHNVQNTGGTVRPQWAQIDVTGATIATAPVQQQIYAPDTTLHRWMGSIAADRQGNVALGYSTSNGTSPNFPSIAYSGRLATDPLNSLSQAESQLIAGAGSQNNGVNRWGDYTAMSVDPVDDCTFWYTNEYYSGQASGTSGDWQTRIGSFKFPSCTAVLSSTTALTSSKNPSVFGDNVTFTATVTAGSGTPAGTVTFKDGAATRATVVLSAGKAAFTTATLAGGTHPITAVYGGSASYAGSTSPVLSQVVNRQATSTAVVSSLNPSTFGKAVTFTATVKPATSGTPTGTATFKDGATTLATVALSAGKAAITTSTLALGTHSITVIYAASVSYAGSTSPKLTQTVH
jgi:hypothetical protein